MPYMACDLGLDGTGHDGWDMWRARMTGPMDRFKGTILMEDMYGELLPAQDMADGWMGGGG